MIDTPRTDALVGNFDFPWSFDTETLVRHAETLERELAERLRDVNALMSDIRKGDEMLMAWFKAASPYATPGSLERGLKKLREEFIEECALVCESRAGEGQYAESPRRAART